MLSDISHCEFSFEDNNGKYRVKLLIEGGINPNLCGLFNTVEISEIPSFLDDVMLRSSRSSRYGGFLKGPIFEDRPNEKDLDIKENQILIDNGGSNFSPPEIIELNLFYKLSLVYAHKCLELVTWFDLFDKRIVTKDWIDRIRSWILRFEVTTPLA